MPRRILSECLFNSDHRICLPSRGHRSVSQRPDGVVYLLRGVRPGQPGAVDGYKMMVQHLDKKYEVPEDLIIRYEQEFSDYNMTHDKDYINAVRNATIIMIALFKAYPDMLEGDEGLDDFRHAHAMREALNRTKLLYDA